MHIKYLTILKTLILILNKIRGKMFIYFYAIVVYNMRITNYFGHKIINYHYIYIQGEKKTIKKSPCIYLGFNEINIIQNINTR